MNTKTLFVPLLIIAGLIGTSAAQEALEPITSENLISELERLAKSEFGSTVGAAVTAIREFSQVSDSSLQKPALAALTELEKAAAEWGAMYRNKTLPNTYTFDQVELKHKDLVLLHVLRPESVAFVNMENFTDYDLLAIDLLGSVENLTIENCPRFTAFAFTKIRLPNLKILHLNGSGKDRIYLNWIPKNKFPLLKLVNVKDTPFKTRQIAQLKKQLQNTKLKISVLN